MLPHGKAVRCVVLRTSLQDGLLSTMKSGMLQMGMSSSSPTGTRELGEELSNAGIVMVDAHVSGGVKRAETGTLAIVASGCPHAVERCRAVFQFLGTEVSSTGPLGSGHATSTSMKAM